MSARLYTRGKTGGHIKRIPAFLCVFTCIFLRNSSTKWLPKRRAGRVVRKKSPAISNALPNGHRIAPFRVSPFLHSPFGGGAVDTLSKIPFWVHAAKAETQFIWTRVWTSRSEFGPKRVRTVWIILTKQEISCNNFRSPFNANRSMACGTNKEMRIANLQ